MNIRPDEWRDADSYASEVVDVLAGGSATLTPAELLFDTAGKSLIAEEVPLYYLPEVGSKGLLRLITSIRRVTPTPAFRKDLRKLPQSVQQKWTKVIALLAENVRHRSLNFEKLPSLHHIWSVRVDRSYRATLRLLPSGDWDAMRIGPHDQLYRNPV